MSNDLIQRLRGRAYFLRDRGEVKSPDLLEEAAKALESATTDMPRLSRYFPSMPPGNLGWQMTPHEQGEWVLFSDVERWWTSGKFKVVEWDDIRSQTPISYSVTTTIDGKPYRSFQCGTWDDGKRNAEWLVARLNANADPKDDISECQKAVWSSRMCERGTRSCEIRHK